MQVFVVFGVDPTQDVQKQVVKSFPNDYLIAVPDSNGRRTA